PCALPISTRSRPFTVWASSTRLSTSTSTSTRRTSWRSWSSIRSSSPTCRKSRKRRPSPRATDSRPAKRTRPGKEEGAPPRPGSGAPSFNSIAGAKSYGSGDQGKNGDCVWGLQGPGAGSAEKLAEAGVNIVLNARSEAPLREAAQEIAERYGVEVRPVAGDVTTPEGRARLLDAAPA